MTHMYHAILHGDRLEWVGEAPASPPNQPLRVQVTLDERPSVQDEAARGPALAQLLEKVATRGALSGIADPVKWQQELRQGRTLPGRQD